MIQKNNIINLKIINGRYANLKTLYSISEKSIIIEAPSQIDIDTGVHEIKLVVIKKEDIKNIEYTSYKKDNSGKFALIVTISIWVILTLYRLQVNYRFYNSEVVLFEVAYSGMSAAFWGFVFFLVMKFFKKDYQIIRLVTSENDVLDFKHQPIFKKYLTSDFKLGQKVFTKGDDIIRRETSIDFEQKFNDLSNIEESNMESFQEFPENVKLIVEFIASNRASILQQLSKEGITDEPDVNEISAIISLERISGLKNRVSIDLIEKAHAVTGVFEDKSATVFEYEDWYINPSAIIMKSEHIPFATSKNKVTPSTVLFKRQVACLLAESYGRNAYGHIGVDFTTEKWINILSKEDGLIGVLMMFLKASIKASKFDDYMLYIFISNPDQILLDDYCNKSKMAVKFIVEELLELGSKIDVFNAGVDLYKEVKIVSSEQFINNGLYWIEIGKFYAIFSTNKPSSVYIGPLENLKHSKKEIMSLMDCIKNNRLGFGKLAKHLNNGDELKNLSESKRETFQDLPENIKQIIELIASCRASTVQKLSKEVIVDELDVNDFSAMLSLGEIGSLKNRVSIDLIEKALLINGMFKGKPATVFEYKDWYINPAAIIMEDEYVPYAISKMHVTPSNVLLRKQLACFLAESYGRNAFEFIGIDFTTEKWINILSKEDGLIGVLMMFLRASITTLGFEDYLFYFFISNPSSNLLKDYSNKSKMAVRFVIEELINLCLEISAFNGEIDFFNEIKIVSSKPFIDNGLYWVEIGNFYAIYSKTKPSNVDIGPLKTLFHSKKESMTLAEYIRTTGLESGIRLGKREKASPIDF